MKVANLPSKTGKGEDRIEQVTNKKLYEKADASDPRKEKGVVFSIPAENFAYPQFESVEEFVNDCGGADKALARMNEATMDRAVSSGKNYIRSASTGTEQEIVEKGLKVAKEFSWSKVESTISAATVKTTVSDLRTKFKAGEITADELADAVSKLDI